ncbi:unnamed protein product [Allacma fusca]|uniref:Uncharacterized protein n=1 Tax=Allacma fusca TaxID=39272 RepID=A0A8J2NZW2_9HEXA|nr:unnamed protein product [Allacma fusca]
MGKSKGKKTQQSSNKTQTTQPPPESSVPSTAVSVEKDLSNLAVSKTNEQVRPVVDNNPSLLCPVCTALAVSKCGGCNKVGYCSRDHQKQHWKIHKNECTSWKISQSPELGRYLIATRDIKAGSIILQEKPLLLTPPRITAPVCLGCYNEFLPPEDQSGDQEIKPGSCPDGCGWPMCNTESCKSDRVDHGAECKLTLARGGVNVRNFGQDHPMYQSIGILRALHLKETSPELYKQLLSLQSHSTEQDKALKAQQQEGVPQPDLAMTVNLICKFFNQEKNNVNEDLVKQLVGIVETNGHEIPLPGNYGQINRRLVGIYNVSSLLEHNCRPNCVKSWGSKSKEIVIRSSIAIKKGDHLSISYVDPLWGTNDRQNFLQMTKFFTCKCERCQDPTELGCHISSIRCQQIQCSTKIEAEERAGVGQSSSTGMIVPEDALNPESKWKCLSCGEVYPVKYASSIAEKIGREAEEFQEKRGDADAEEDFLRKYSKVLAKNHFYLLEIKVELAQLYGRTAGEPLPMLPPQKLLRKKVLCEELLKVFNIIVPGFNRLRALILYEYQAAIATLSKLKHSIGDISTKAHIDDLARCKQLITEVVQVLSWEPELSVEYRRCEGAKRELADLDETVELLREMQTSIAVSVHKPETSDGQPNNFITNQEPETTVTTNEFEEDLELF